jgi:methyl-accepting chemotaxis protein
MVPDLEEPQWAPFEAVHISLNIKDVLAQQSRATAVRAGRETIGASSSPPPPSLPRTSQAGPSTEDLQLQIRELTSSNQELRGRLEEQSQRMEQLNQQLEQLRGELGKAKSKTQPARKTPAQ